MLRVPESRSSSRRPARIVGSGLAAILTITTLVLAVRPSGAAASSEVTPLTSDRGATSVDVRDGNVVFRSGDRVYDCSIDAGGTYACSWTDLTPGSSPAVTSDGRAVAFQAGTEVQVRIDGVAVPLATPLVGSQPTVATTSEANRYLVAYQAAPPGGRTQVELALVEPAGLVATATATATAPIVAPVGWLDGGDTYPTTGGDSTDPALAPDGSQVIFATDATNLVPGNKRGIVARDLQVVAGRIQIEIPATQVADPGGFTLRNPTVSDNLPGWVQVWERSDGTVWAKRADGTVLRLDEALDVGGGIGVVNRGTPASNASVRPRVSADGTKVVFTSSNPNLVPDDTNGVDDVFVYHFATARRVRASIVGTPTMAPSYVGVEASDASGARVDTASNRGAATDGAYVVFTSRADLAPTVAQPSSPRGYVVPVDNPIAFTPSVSVTAGSGRADLTVSAAPGALGITAYRVVAFRSTGGAYSLYPSTLTCPSTATTVNLRFPTPQPDSACHYTGSEGSLPPGRYQFAVVAYTPRGASAHGLSPVVEIFGDPGPAAITTFEQRERSSNIPPSVPQPPVRLEFNRAATTGGIDATILDYDYVFIEDRSTDPAWVWPPTSGWVRISGTNPVSPCSAVGTNMIRCNFMQDSTGAMLRPGVDYRFAIRTVHPVSGLVSGIQERRVSERAQPVAPGVPRVVQEGINFHTIAWDPIPNPDDPASNGGEAVVYESIFEQLTASGSTWKEIEASRLVTPAGGALTRVVSTDDTWYLPGVTYRAKVRTYNNAYVSAWVPGGMFSRKSYPPWEAACPVSAKAVPAATLGGYGDVIVEWCGVQIPNGEVTSYTVNVSPPLAGQIEVPADPGQVTYGVRFEKLRTGQIYDFVVCYRLNGSTTGLCQVSPKVTLQGPPWWPDTAAGRPRATPGDATATVVWSAANAVPAMTGYHVIVEPGGRTIKLDAAGKVVSDSAQTEGASSGSSSGSSSSYLSLVVNNLTNGIPYTFSVVPFNTLGAGDAMPTTPVTPKGKPTAPVDVLITPGPKELTISWKPPTNDGGAPVDSYIVTVTPPSTSGSGSDSAPPTRPIEVVVNATANSTTVTGLQNGTKYAVSVVARNVYGAGPASSTEGQTRLTSGDGGGASPGAPTGDPTPTKLTPVRMEGDSRYATAAAISAAVFPEGVEVAYVATGENFPDGLALGPAAAADRSPVLLVTHNEIPQPTVVELGRLQPRRIVIAGDNTVVSDKVAGELWRYTTGEVVRLQGATRFATAAAVSASRFAPGVPVAYVATGRAFPDAVVAGAAAAREGGPLLLTEPTGLPAATKAELERLQPQRIVVIGTSDAVSGPVENELRRYAPAVERVGGASRYETASAIARASFSAPAAAVFVATGENFPDALAAVPAAAMTGAPIVLMPPDGPTGDLQVLFEQLTPAKLVAVGDDTVVSKESLEKVQLSPAEDEEAAGGSDK